MKSIAANVPMQPAKAAKRLKKLTTTLGSLSIIATAISWVNPIIPDNGLKEKSD